jgi:diadenosine tetraphosphate (Ap4A) HIT family hydrolase
MNCVICAWTPDDLEYRFVYETKLWRVVLAPNQCLIGTCVVHLKRHSGDLAELTKDEILDWLDLVKNHEAALQGAFGATMFNWSCYMNHAYREKAPNPHIHWWAVPRYNHVVSIENWHFEDPQFGNPYNHDRWLEVPNDIHQHVGEQIRNALLKDALPNTTYT